MKAYEAMNYDTGYGTVVFAETRGKARSLLMNTDEFDGYEFIEISPRRVKELDSEYRGRSQMDWRNDEDRIAMVKAGWTCGDDSFNPDYCERCPANEYCSQYEDYQIES